MKIEQWFNMLDNNDNTHIYKNKKLRGTDLVNTKEQEYLQEAYYRLYDSYFSEFGRGQDLKLILEYKLELANTINLYLTTGQMHHLTMAEVIREKMKMLLPQKDKIITSGKHWALVVNKTKVFLDQKQTSVEQYYNLARV